MSGMTRRAFLAASAAGVAALSVRCTSGPGILGANSDVRVAFIGTRGKGSDHYNYFKKIPGVRFAAVCDVDTAILDRDKARFAKENREVGLYTTDLRRVLDDKSIDAVVIATPNHWHSLAAIWACQAGKDVYVEKPVSHEIWEGRKIVEAARKYGRIVQAGTQSRSDQGLMDLIAYLRRGAIGKIQYVRALCYKERGSIGKVTGPQPVPPTVDYDLWCGPAPKDPLLRKHLHYDWHWVWPTGNGDIGNQGIHEMDMARWILGQPGLPARVVSFGGRFGYDDDGQTPNTQIALLDYQPAPILFEVRGLPRKTGEKVMDHLKGARVGIIVQCEGGYYAGGANGGWVYDRDDNKLQQFAQNGMELHQANFIQAVRSRKVSDLHAFVEQAALSSTLCHMANISYRLGRPVTTDESAAALRGNALLAEGLERVRTHLAANDVDLAAAPLHLGAALEFDGPAERFVGPQAAAANALTRRQYREPFAIRDEV
jgi:predicted dehydrogenase